MIPVLIIGYGNPLRSDDGVGWLAARALLSLCPARSVRVEAAHQLLPEMTDWVADAGFVIFIDASWDAVPGRIRARTIQPDGPRTRSITHHFSPQGLLADAQHHAHRCPETVLVTVGGDSFDYGESLSPGVAAVFPGLLSLVKEYVQVGLARASCGKAEIHA